MIRGVDVAAAAVAHAEPVQLAPSEHGHALLPLQGQHAVVFQQHAALRAGPADQLADPRRHVPLPVRRRLLLHESVPHGPVDEALGDLSQFPFQLAHDDTPSMFFLYYTRAFCILLAYLYA